MQPEQEESPPADAENILASDTHTHTEGTDIPSQQTHIGKIKTLFFCNSMNFLNLFPIPPMTE